MVALGTEYKAYGLDAIYHVRHLWFPPGPERMLNPRAQFSLWPTPRGGFSIVDAHAIKVGGTTDLLGSIATD